MQLLKRIRNAWAALRGEKEEPMNGGHRYAIMSTSDVYCYADAVRIDPISGDPIWFCDRGDHCELKRKLPGWGILVDLKPDMTLEEFLGEKKQS